MNRQTRETFYLIWLIAIIACAVIAVVVLLFTAISPAPTPASTYDDAIRVTASTEPVEIIIDPTATPESTETPESPETTESPDTADSADGGDAVTDEAVPDVETTPGNTGDSEE